MIFRMAFLLLWMSFSVMGFSQITAVTSEGDEVVLFHDGTWEYANDAGKKIKEIPLNETEFTRTKEATFQVKSKIAPVGVYLNPKKWSFSKAKEGEASEYEFQLKEKDAYAMLIAERIEIPIDALKNLAFENAKAVAPDIKIVNEEFRNVNGTRVLFIQMNGTIQGIKFSYYGYYHAFENGTVQFLTYTSQNLLEKYKDDLEELLNGFVLLK